MGFDQYHEPPEELPQDARSIMSDSLGEEFKHFCIDLGFLVR